MAPLIDCPASILLLLLLSAHLASGAARVLNIVDLGAVPARRVDAAGALLRAWAAACASPEPATIHVPAGEFLVVGPVVFQGRCKNRRVKFLVEGTLVAAGDYDGRGDVSHWIKFEQVEGVSVHGGGRIDGKGAALWRCKDARRGCPYGSMSLYISHSAHVNVSDLTLMNSKFFHVMVGGSSDIRLHNLTILAPGDSPNTDGIHVQGSDGVIITQATIRTGDDCISLGPGSTNVIADGIFCGPGHGISIGSLGSQESEAGVRNIRVRNVFLSGTQNGVRIKTWAKPSNGFVHGVSFYNVNMQDVKNPIIIDQNYCPHRVDCPRHGSGVKISDVTYSCIQGTSASPVITNFDCSPRKPCTGIQMHNVNLTYGHRGARSVCEYAVGTTSGYINPPACLWR